MQIKIGTKKLITASVLASTLLLSQSANAGLIARTISDATFGNVEAYYDDVLDLTWLKDANFAKTSGYAATGFTGIDAVTGDTVVNVDGKMTWADANAWAGQLQIGTFDDWRLTSVQPQDGSTVFNENWADDGTTDVGYNITSQLHEMAYMFHVNLGLEGDDGGTGFHNAALDTAIDTVSLGNNIAIDNLMSYVYWDDVEYAPYTGNAWAFLTVDGVQYDGYKGYSFFGWAVRSGDVGASTPVVSSVPEPTTLAIFSLGLLGLVARRKSA